tara:strand:+ start:2108 stop:3064 length:957 start_codon:yes stop_codon:yes gene_type:complete
MNFLKKIKLEYNIKLFNDHISSQQFDLAYKFILDLNEKDKVDFFLLLKNCYEKFIDLPNDFYKKKIIWTLSYDLDDLSFINKFLNYYLSKNSKSTFCYENYANTLSNFFTNNNIGHENDQIGFNDFIKYSDLYQNLILFDCSKEFLFLESCASFFETNQKNYFTNNNITFCYFYILAKPENLYLKYKNIYNSSEASFDNMFNFSDQSFLNPEQKNQKIKTYENRTNLNTNVKSWVDPNVIDTYKGKIISYNRLLEEPEEVLIEILIHLKQYDFDLDINMDDIKKFVSSHSITDFDDIELSKNEKKFLDRNLDKSISFD